MHRDSATTVIERTPSVRKRREFSIAPYCVILAIALLGVLVAVHGAADRVASGAKSKYDSIFSEPMATERMVFVPAQPVSVKYRHVIFRVGKWEICRFTYEEREPDDAREDGHE